MQLIEFTEDPQYDNRKNDAIARVRVGPAVVEVELVRCGLRHNWRALSANVVQGEPELVDTIGVMAWLERRVAS